MHTGWIRILITVYVFHLPSCTKPYNPVIVPDESAGYTVSTVAGGQDAGYINATGTDAKFNYPGGLVIDAANNIYVADRLNHRIRKISSSNVVTTFAGTGTAGGANGNVSTAEFDFPIYLAMDALGNLFVVDSMRLRIRKITPAGEVTTFNPNRAPGYGDGLLATAQFGSIDGIAIDNAGNFFIPDGVNRRIRKISPAGIVSTLAGSGVDGYADGTGAAAQFSLALNQITIDQQGNLYVTDNTRIRKITQAGVVSTPLSLGDGVSFVGATGLAVDPQGTVCLGVSQMFAGPYLAKINSSGDLVKIAGAGIGYSDGVGSSAKFGTISFITIGQDATVIISDNERIRKVKKN